MGVRRAVPSDLSAVLRIGAGGFVGDDPFDAQWLVDKLAEPGTQLVVDDAGANLIRGFLVIQRYTSGTVVRLIAVDPQFRRQGVGKRLLARVKGPAGAAVREENAPSRAMFEKAGWEQTVKEWVEESKPSEAHSGNWVYYALQKQKVV